MCIFVCTQEIATSCASTVLLPHSRYKVDVRIGNHRKKILSLPNGWEPSGRTRTLSTSGNDEKVRVKWMEVYRCSTVTFFRLSLLTLSQSLDYSLIIRRSFNIWTILPVKFWRTLMHSFSKSLSRLQLSNDSRNENQRNRNHC